VRGASIVALALPAALTGCLQVPGSDPTDCAARIAISLDNAGVAESVEAPPRTLEDVPVRVVLDGAAQDALFLGTFADRLRFVGDGGALLAFDLAPHRPGEATTAWVRVPTVDLERGTQRIWAIATSDAGAPPGAAPADVWSDFVGVWHMHESPTDAEPQLRDASPAARHATIPDGLAADRAVDAPSGGGLHFTDAEAGARATSDGIALADGVTLEAVVQLDDPIDPTPYRLALGVAGTMHILPVRAPSPNGEFLFSWLRPSDQVRVDTQAQGTYPLSAAPAWIYLAGVYDAVGGTIGFYVDGRLDGDPAPINGAAVALTSDLVIGDYAQGIVDEARVSLTARAPAWIALQARAFAGTYATPGAVEACE
jgi:hypothetical protein